MTEPATEEGTTEEAAPPVPSAEDAAPSPDSASADTARLFVSLPAEAKLFVNGSATSSQGTNRHFVSKGLKAGFKYPYTVKAVMSVDGKEVVQSKQIELTAGSTEELAFDFNAVATELTIELPENAELELAGVTTKSTGAVRTFVTNNLSAGQVWSNYKVVVTLDELTKEQTIDLKGGEQRTLSFSFDDTKVAAR